MLTPPEAFGIVEDGVYRCSSVDPLNFAFLETLGLNTLISLNPGRPPKPIRTFAQDNSIHLIHLGLQPWRTSSDWMILSQDLIQNSLKFVLDTSNHPILILDSTNAFVGVLRRIQHWNYSSVVAEYRAFSGGKPHYMTEIFLEFVQARCQVYELETGLIQEPLNQLGVENNVLNISLPPASSLPEWFVYQQKLWQEDCQKLAVIKLIDDMI